MEKKCKIYGNIYDMSNVMEFKKKQNEYVPNSDHMFTLTMYMTPGEYEVEIEMADWASDQQVFEALVGTAMRFSTDNDLLDEETESQLIIEDEDES